MSVPPSDRIRELAARAAADERLTEDELDEVFDEWGLSTQEQFVALAVAREWVPRPERRVVEMGSLGWGSFYPVTSIQRAYLEAFDRSIRDPTDTGLLLARFNALNWVIEEARDRRARGEFPELDEDEDERYAA